MSFMEYGDTAFFMPLIANISENSDKSLSSALHFNYSIFPNFSPCIRFLHQERCAIARPDFLFYIIPVLWIRYY